MSTACTSRCSGSSRVIRSAVGSIVTVLIATGLAVLGPVPAASASVGTAPYTIGAPTDAVSEVVAAPSAVVEDAMTSFTVTFLATAALSASDSGSVTVSASSPLGSLPSAVSIVDVDDMGCIQGSAGGGVVTTASMTIDLNGSCQIEAGNQVQVSWTAASPIVAGNFEFTVTTSVNAAPATSNGIAV
ncbi:MAG TPA: hypothetical protein VME46_00345, partial [Acidimicrobiales bacterium]|nr:hypothetical protein [Acidimicrobiales bacterium]